MDNDSAPEGNGSRKRQIVVIVLLVVVLAIAAYTLTNRQTAEAPNEPAQNNNAQQTKPSLYFEAGAVSLGIGQADTISLWLDTGGDAVNAVMATFTYPTNLLAIDNIDTSNSPFSNKIETNDQAGAVSLSLGSDSGNLTGKLLLATITLTAKSEGVASLAFTDESAAVKTTDTINTVNILKDHRGMTITIKAAN